VDSYVEVKASACTHTCMHSLTQTHTHTHSARLHAGMPTSHSLVGMVMLVFLMPHDQLKEVLLFF